MEDKAAGSNNTHQLEQNPNKSSNQKQQVDTDNDREMNQKTETIGAIAMGLNGVTSFTLITITAFISYLALDNGVVLFSFHPILMAIGVRILITFPRKNKQSNHCIILFISVSRFDVSSHTIYV